ncbi:MAG: MFS transporter [Aquimonas sp.]|jgi:PAT family beta-lactamase induction signal transducer AmpG|nr:MFS transporter [Xanthomonadales bacterium]MCC6506042.1 MFS transporter [Aquimonas sp.]
MNLPWRDRLPAGLRAYTEREPLAALLLGMSSGFPYAMIGATLTTRLAQDGIDKRSVTAFSLAFLVYNLKFLWAPLIDSGRLPGISHLGQRLSWLCVTAAMVVLALSALAFGDPRTELGWVAMAAVAVGVAGASFDIVIDAFRIESLRSDQLGIGSGMSQYGWRIGSVAAGSLALLVAMHSSWTVSYLLCAVFVLPALVAGFWLGEPTRRRPALPVRGMSALWSSISGPIREFFQRHGAWLVLLFVLLHKIGDTLANLTLRLLLNDLGFSNEEIATWDVGLGFFAYLAGIFLGGVLYSTVGMKRSVLLALILMAVSNLSFAWLAANGHSNALLAFTIGFENIASGVGGVVVVAYLSALCNLAFTATQFALLSAAASVVGRLITGTTAGQMIESFGYVNFYLFTTVIALPGLLLYLYLLRSGAVELSLGHHRTTSTSSDGAPHRLGG